MAASKVEHTFYEASCFAVVTGASRGIGRAIAIEFAKRFEKKLHLVLTARTKTGLQETSALIENLDTYSLERITIRLVPGDLGNEAVFPCVLDELFVNIDASKYQRAILVSNAASPGDITKFGKDFSVVDAPLIQQDLFLNVTATLLMSSKFMSVFPSHPPNDNTDGDERTRRTIIQISSGAGQGPYASWIQYCTGKAARDMLHKVIAAEEPDVRVLSYAPGVVDTVMFRDVVYHSASPETAQYMARYLEVAMTPAESASVLCDVLLKDEYESGALVDAYNIIGDPICL